MTQSPKIFISFSSRDQNEVRKLFSALNLQNIEVWDYSDAGQELPLAHSIESSLKRKIDECDYFIAVISSNSVHEETSRYTRFEVFYALEKELHKQNRILPLVLQGSGDSVAKWLDLYPDFRTVKWSEINFADNLNLENGLREICDWLSVSYIPSSLRDARVFFARQFLTEAETIKIEKNEDFIDLMRIMNDCAARIAEENWESARDEVSFFLMRAKRAASSAIFHYPIIIRGICEFQLNELENARRTLLSLTTDPNCGNRQIMGLGLAALGYISVSLEDYEAALEYHRKAAEFLPKGNDLPVNEELCRAYLGASSWDERLLSKFDENELSADNLLKIIKMQGIINYKKGDFYNAVEDFQSITLKNLDECAAIYYGLSLMQIEWFESAIEMLSCVAENLDSDNIYHHLADVYLQCEYFEEALSVYDQKLCIHKKIENQKRQFFVEYARILRYLDAETNQRQICGLCEEVLDLARFPDRLTKEDFFYMGYANFLLGKHDLARFDFERSQGFCEKYYSEIDF